MMSADASQRIVICMKWGTKYGPEYVNRLYAMVRRHLTGDFRMVCLTDDATGIRNEVECFPIPALDLPPGIPERGWTKLVSFAEDLYGLKGTALFLDVDVVVVGSLDGFFEVPGEFLVIHDYKRPWRITGNSSVYRFELGAHPDVLRYFRTHVDEVRKEFRNEQAYLSDFLHQAGQTEILADCLVPQLQVPRHPDMALQLLEAAVHPGRCPHRHFSRRMQSARCAGRATQPPFPVHSAGALDCRTLARITEPHLEWG